LTTFFQVVCSHKKLLRRKAGLLYPFPVCLEKYSYGWKAWCVYSDGLGWPNYYLTTATRKQKVKLLVNFFRARHAAGLRRKQATEAVAAVRKYFSKLKDRSQEFLFSVNQRSVLELSVFSAVIELVSPEK
jgi:hypothetical protein